VLSVAPLGLIGVVAALLAADKPLGFVALLGVLALTGMIARNSVILIHQVEVEKEHGRHPWDAVVEATTHRFRPILLTAAAAILGMIPIAPTIFWGPMAYAIMGGLAGRNAAHARVPSGPLRGVVPDQNAPSRASRTGTIRCQRLTDLRDASAKFA
jgi:multidrug efflux pump subunit AcrB